jgi:hypothetical protein
MRNLYGIMVSELHYHRAQPCSAMPSKLKAETLFLSQHILSVTEPMAYSWISLAGLGSILEIETNNEDSSGSSSILVSITASP